MKLAGPEDPPSRRFPLQCLDHLCRRQIGIARLWGRVRVRFDGGTAEIQIPSRSTEVTGLLSTLAVSVDRNRHQRFGRSIPPAPISRRARLLPSSAVPIQQLEPIAAFAAEDEEIAAERILPSCCSTRAARACPSATCTRTLAPATTYHFGSSYRRTILRSMVEAMKSECVLSLPLPYQQFGKDRAFCSCSLPCRSHRLFLTYQEFALFFIKATDDLCGLGLA
jgi:hypothetical protein